MLILKTNKSLLSNILASGIFQLLFLITPVITTPYVTRIFSPSEIGLYGVSYSVIILLVQIAQFGLPIYGIRAVAQSENKSKVFFELLSIQFLLCIFVFFLFNLFNFLFIDKKWVYFLQSFLILIAVFDVSWFFIGIEEIKKNILRNALSKIVSIVLIFIFVKTAEDLYIYILINILGNLLGNLTMVLQLSKYISWEKNNFRIKKEHVQASFGLLIPQSVDSAKNTISRLIITLLTSYEQVGLYDQGLKVIVMLNGIISSMGGAITPRMAYLVSIKDHNKINNMIKNYLLAIYIFSLILTAGLLSTAPSFSTLFFGKEYGDVVIIIQIASLSILFSSISFFLGKCVLIPFSEDKTYRNLAMYSAIIMIVTTFIFVPVYGSKGAAIAFVLTSIFLSVSSLLKLKKIVQIKKQIKNIFVTLILINVSYYFVLLLESNFTFTNAFFEFLFSGCLSASLSAILSVLLISVNGVKISTLLKINRSL